MSNVVDFKSAADKLRAKRSAQVVTLYPDRRAGAREATWGDLAVPRNARPRLTKVISGGIISVIPPCQLPHGNDAA